MPPELWAQLITLPPTIAKLTSVRKLNLYGSHLVRLPVETGKMSNLEELDLYTSYRLHWLPFELSHCPKLKWSRVSTRALYGNYKYRPPFPRLLDKGATAEISAQCSICQAPLDPQAVRQRWISLPVATDVLPLLVNACSTQCLEALPKPPTGYVDYPHTGGIDLVQPPPKY